MAMSNRIHGLLGGFLLPLLILLPAACSLAPGGGPMADKYAGSGEDARVRGLSGGSAVGITPMPDAGEPAEFHIFVRDSGMTPAARNPVLQTIAELTGVTLHFEFLVGDLDQKLRVMIAGSDYPDAIYVGDAASKLIQAGALLPLENKIPEYPNLNALYGQVLGFMTREDGHVYTMELFKTLQGEVTRPAPVFESELGFYIQKAVLEEFGFPAVRTTEEYFALIEKYMALHPMTEGANTIGFEILNDGWRNWSLVSPPQYLLGAGNDGMLYVDPVTLGTSFYQTGETARRYYKTLNSAYHKGLIAPETLTQSYEQYLARLSTGAVLGFFDQEWNVSDTLDRLKTDGLFNRTYVSLPLTEMGVKDGYIDQESGIPTGINGIGITINCKNPDRFIRFYDWMLRREVQDYLQWGVEGEDWVFSPEGGKVFTERRRAIMYDEAQKRDLTGYSVWYYSPKWQGVYIADGMPAGQEESAAEYLASQSDYDRYFLNSYGIRYPVNMHSEPVARPLYYPIWAMGLEEGSPADISEKRIEELLSKYYPRLILAAGNAEFDATWEAFTTEFEAVDLAAYKGEIDRKIDLLMNRQAG